MTSRASVYERRKPRFKPQPRVLILCEDTKSSRHYLQDAAHHFRAHADVDVSHCGKNDPYGIVTEALERQRYFDKVYCAIDRDTHARFDEAIALALTTGGKVNVVPSYPCYEFWLLLHFRKTRKPYSGVGNRSSADLLIKDLCELPEMMAYEKGGAIGLFDSLIEKLPIARLRSRQILEEAAVDGASNPSTRIHELIDLFEQLSKPQISSQH
jgi:hypothetical protein